MLNVIDKGYEFLEYGFRKVIYKEGKEPKSKTILMNHGIRVAKNKKENFDKANVFFLFEIEPTLKFPYEVFLILRANFEIEGEGDSEEREDNLVYKSALLYFRLAELEFKNIFSKINSQDLEIPELDLNYLLAHEMGNKNIYLPLENFTDFK